MCAFFGKSATDAHAAKRNQDKIHEKEDVNEMLFLEALLFLRVQCVEEHRRVESAFTLKLTTRNSDDANGYSQIGSAQ